MTEATGPVSTAAWWLSRSPHRTSTAFPDRMGRSSRRLADRRRDVVHSWLAAGPRIYIEFKEARGLEAGKTHISYKDVVVGTVSSVSLSKDHSRVIAVVDMAQSVRDMLKEDTRFWIVRPQIGASGISGIETLLSGVYITLDPGTSNNRKPISRASTIRRWSPAGLRARVMCSRPPISARSVAARRSISTTCGLAGSCRPTNSGRTARRSPSVPLWMRRTIGS